MDVRTAVITAAGYGTRFQPSGEFKRKLVTDFAVGDVRCCRFIRPGDLAVDSQGNLYVTDKTGVQVFSSDGQFERKWGYEGASLGDDGLSETVASIAVGGDGNIHVALSRPPGVQVFSPAGEFLYKWGSTGTGDGQFEEPVWIAVGSQGNIYVADRSHGVQVFTPGGEFVRNPGGFQRAIQANEHSVRFRYLAVDSKGNTYRLRSDRRVVVFSPSGQLVTEWGSYGGGDIQFGAPGGISEGMNGDVYVLDHRQVSVFRVDLGAQ